MRREGLKWIGAFAAPISFERWIKKSPPDLIEALNTPGRTEI